MLKTLAFLNLAAALLPDNPIAFGNWVVLGFLAGLLVAQWIDRKLSA